MRTGFRTACTLVVGLLAGSGVPSLASMPNVDVAHPLVFPHAAVNLVVLPYNCADGPGPLEDTGRQLALLLQLDTFFTMLKYGSVGAVHTVRMDTSQECDPDAVVDMLLGAKKGAAMELARGRGLVVFWGRVYREGNDVYVRNYVRFLRRGVEEGLAIALEEQQFQGRLSSQELAFPPSHLTAQDLSSIQSEFQQSVKVRKQPRPDSPAVASGDLSQALQAFWVADVRGGWIRIESSGPGLNGWVRAEAGGRSWSLRSKLPELDFIDLVVGYLRQRVGREAGAAPPARTLEWVEHALKRFEARVAGKRAETPLAVGKQLAGILRMESGRTKPGDLLAAQAAFAAGATLMPYSASARNLEMIGRICTAYWGPPDQVDGLARKLGKGLPRATADDLLGTIVLDPKNMQVVDNLQGLYQLLKRKPPAGANAPDSLRPDELKERIRRLDMVRATRARTKH